MITKTDVFAKLNELLSKNIDILKQEIKSARESQANDTKSSAGDKFETGRSMIQIEIAKNEAQLHKTQLMKHELGKIDANKKLDSAQFGSMIETNMGNYFISLPLGKLEVEKTSLFCISLASPIGQVLQGKKVGDKVEFQGKLLEIISIA